MSRSDFELEPVERGRLHGRLEQRRTGPGRAALARYRAMSASRSSSWADARSPVAIPMLAVTVMRQALVTRRPGTACGSTSRIRSATISGPGGERDALGQDHELVPAEPPDGVAGPQHADEPPATAWSSLSPAS